MSNEVREKRDLVLPPGTYAYMQDTTKGVIKTYTGPTVINPTAQERPVLYDAPSNTFRGATTLDEAQRTSPTAKEGQYLVLHAPAKADKHPSEGSSQPSEELLTGRKIVVPGPATFALWPGQVAEVFPGHHLRSNQYLLVRVYNEDEAMKNWNKAVVKPAADGGETTPASTATAKPPEDLTVGRQLIIKGTEVSFYIPPTGIEVVALEADLRNDTGSDRFVRDALTLERLEYCILVDENGKKRYERGPQVVFPLPSERYVESRGEDNKGLTRKSRAVELNEIQGIHLKVIAPYTENGKTYREGEELFVTGKDTAIYFPREEHSAIKYDGKTKHFATAIPAGEARYVMNRNTGEIRTVKGPAMLLPDPRSEVIVRRVLSDKQAALWYPGNNEALEYNRELRGILANVPTTRSGAISEGDFERNSRSSKGKQLIASAGVAYTASLNATMETSRVSGDQNVGGEEFSRGSSYTAPRTVTLDTKYQGAPSVDVWTSYAVQVVSKTGKRRVVLGPTTVLLDYDEGLEILELSTGKPKMTDTLLPTAYLLADNNKVTDYVTVETSDHVQVKLYLSYLVNFEGDSEKWFSVRNYIKLLCDRARSMLKGAVRKKRIEDFYRTATDEIRDLLLGKHVEGGKRVGMLFEENGMHVADVEVLQVELLDKGIADMLNKSQQDVVRTNIELSGLKRQLDVTKEKELITRESTQAAAETKILRDKIEMELTASTLAVKLASIGNALREADELNKTRLAEEALRNIATQSQLDRVRQEKEQEFEFLAREQAARIEFLKAEAETIVKRFSAATPGFNEALIALTNKDTLVKVAEAWNLQRALGGENVVESLTKVFAGTPLSALVNKMVGAVPQLPNGNGNGKSAPIS